MCPLSLTNYDHLTQIIINFVRVDTIYEFEFALHVALFVIITSTAKLLRMLNVRFSGLGQKPNLTIPNLITLKSKSNPLKEMI